MHETAINKGISHPEVLMVSQELDKVINEFYKMFLNEETDQHGILTVARIKCKLRLCTCTCKFHVAGTYQLVGQAVVNM
jgi:hypothetical protein